METDQIQTRTKLASAESATTSSNIRQTEGAVVSQSEASRTAHNYIAALERFEKAEQQYAAAKEYYVEMRNELLKSSEAIKQLVDLKWPQPGEAVEGRL